MFTNMLYFLPSVVALLWFFTFMFKVKSTRQQLFVWILGLGTFYFATYASYIHPEGDYLTMVKMDAVNEPVIYVLISLIALYDCAHLGTYKLSVPAQALMMIPAAVLGAVLTLLYYLLGFEQAATIMECIDSGHPYPAELNTHLTQIFVFFDVIVIKYYCMIFLAFIFGFSVMIMKQHGYRLGDVCRFLFKGKKTSPSRVIAFLQIFFFISFSPIVFLGRDFMNAHPAIGATTTVLFAIVMHLIAYVEFFGHADSMMTLHDLSHIMPVRSNTEEGAQGATSETSEVMGAETSAGVRAEISTDARIGTGAGDGSQVRRSSKNDVMLEKLVSLFEKEEVYRRDDLTLEVLSQMAGVGRTTLSSLINLHYGASFRDVVNRYRIEAVKKCLLENPDATQEAVASQCGFKDASSLNKKFRELENDTPLLWLTRYKAKSEATV